MYVLGDGASWRASVVERPGIWTGIRHICSQSNRSIRGRWKVRFAGQHLGSGAASELVRSTLLRHDGGISHWRSGSRKEDVFLSLLGCGC